MSEQHMTMICSSLINIVTNECMLWYGGSQRQQRICLLSPNELAHMCFLTGKLRWVRQHRKYLYSVCSHPLYDTPGQARLQTRPDQQQLRCNARHAAPQAYWIDGIDCICIRYKYLHSLRFEDKFPKLTSSQCGSRTKRLSNNNMLIAFIYALRCDYTISFFKDKATFMTFL